MFVIQYDLDQNMIRYDFSGKKVLVTGATGGIGSEVAKMFATANAILFISGTNSAKIENFINELKTSNPNNNQIFGQACDLSKNEEVEKLISSANEKMGGLDILVCNAGITNDKLAIRMTNEDFSSVIQINLIANFILNREAIKIMSKQRYGRIINIASVVGIIGNAGQANYAASKAGLIGMTKTLATEAAKRNITVNVVAPGFTNTNMTDKLPEGFKEEMVKQIPMGDYATVKDIANATLFLASKESGYITGTVTNVSGGMVRS